MVSTAGAGVWPDGANMRTLTRRERLNALDTFLCSMRVEAEIIREFGEQEYVRRVMKCWQEAAMRARADQGRWGGVSQVGDSTFAAYSPMEALC